MELNCKSLKLLRHNIPSSQPLNILFSPPYWLNLITYLVLKWSCKSTLLMGNEFSLTERIHKLWECEHRWRMITHWILKSLLIKQRNIQQINLELHTVVCTWARDVVHELTTRDSFNLEEQKRRNLKQTNNFNRHHSSWRQTSSRRCHLNWPLKRINFHLWSSPTLHLLPTQAHCSGHKHISWS